MLMLEYLPLSAICTIVHARATQSTRSIDQVIHSGENKAERLASTPPALPPWLPFTHPPTPITAAMAWQRRRGEPKSANAVCACRFSHLTGHPRRAAVVMGGRGRGGGLRRPSVLRRGYETAVYE